MSEDGLTQLQMLAAIGVLAALAREEERDALRVSAAIGGVTMSLPEAAAARSWLDKKLRTLDVRALQEGGNRAD